MNLEEMTGTSLVQSADLFDGSAALFGKCWLFQLLLPYLTSPL